MAQILYVICSSLQEALKYIFLLTQITLNIGHTGAKCLLTFITYTVCCLLNLTYIDYVLY